jgi:parvulin-like peptidyl-prolyl isomerase
MKKIIFFCLFFITSGCSVFQPEEPPLIQPKLLKQSELPPLTEPTYSNYFEFFCEMQINANGDVEKVKLLTGSGDTNWDSLATLSLLNWKYSPAIYGGHPIKLTVRRKIKVVFVEPTVFSLSEIQLDNKETADSVYQALLKGTDFISLVLKYSTSDSKTNNGFIGNVNVKHFSEEISLALSQLKEDEFTKPLSYGEHYVIFKRMKLNN